MLTTALPSRAARLARRLTTSRCRALVGRRARVALLALSALAVAPRGAAAARAVAAYFTGRVEAYATNRHTLYVGQENYVVVRGDGDTDLDCWLYNPAGRLVSSDDDTTDYCILSAPDVGTHRVVIRNLGRVYNAYTVFTR